MTITSSTLSGNSALGDFRIGGAIANDGTMTITSSTLSDNSAFEAGAIYANTGTVTITGSTLSGNSASDGGAIVSGGTLTITSSTLSGNSALGDFGDGGAIANTEYGTVTITSSTLSGNSASSLGGAIENRYGGRVTITNSTLSGNSASHYGGAIYNTEYGTMAIGASIIANSTAGLGGNCYGNAITDRGYNLTDTNGNCGLTGSTDQQNTDPKLSALANNGGPTLTMALQLGSMAIDRIPTTADFIGTTTPACSSTDQRGMSRPDDSESFCDIGAYESAYTLTPTTLSVSPASGTYGGTTTLTATLSPAVSGKTVIFSLNGAAVCGGTTGVTCPATGANGTATLQNVSLGTIPAGTYPGSGLCNAGTASDGVFASFSGDSSYAGSSGCNTLTVTQATLTVVPAAETVQYSDPVPPPGYSLTGYVGTDSPSTVPITGSPTCGPTAAVTLGTFPSATGGGSQGVDMPAGAVPNGLSCTPGTLATTNPNYTFGTGTNTLTVTQEDAAVQVSASPSAAMLPSSGSSTITLTATVWDSAAKGYSGTNAESLSAGTIGDITKLYVEFDIYPSSSCLSGTPAFSPVVQVSTTGTAGVGTAQYLLSQSQEGSFCVVPRVVAGPATASGYGAANGGTNPYYTAPDGQVQGIAFYQNTGQFATGGGWVTDATSSSGKGTFGFNARYTKASGAKGQMVYVWQGMYGGQLADFIVKSNAITTLSFSGTAPSFSATLQGKASYAIVSVATGQQLYGEGNDTFIATATDGDNGLSQNVGTDRFSLSVFNSKNSNVHPVAPTPLGGGNIAAHS